MRGAIQSFLVRAGGTPLSSAGRCLTIHFKNDASFQGSSERSFEDSRNKKRGAFAPPFCHPERRSQIGSKFDSPALLATQRGPASAIFSNVLDPSHFGSVGRAGIFPGVAIVYHPGGQLSHLSVSLGHTVISPPSWLKTQGRKLKSCQGNVKRNFREGGCSKVTDGAEDHLEVSRGGATAAPEDPQV